MESRVTWVKKKDQWEIVINKSMKVVVDVAESAIIGAIVMHQLIMMVQKFANVVAIVNRQNILVMNVKKVCVLFSNCQSLSN